MPPDRSVPPAPTNGETSMRLAANVGQLIDVGVAPCTLDDLAQRRRAPGTRWARSTPAPRQPPTASCGSRRAAGELRGEAVQAVSPLSMCHTSAPISLNERQQLLDAGARVRRPGWPGPMPRRPSAHRRPARTARGSRLRLSVQCSRRQLVHDPGSEISRRTRRPRSAQTAPVAAGFNTSTVVIRSRRGRRRASSVTLRTRGVRSTRHACAGCAQRLE